MDDDKKDEIFSIMKKYEADIEKIESLFHNLKSDNLELQSCYNETKLLKKARLTKLNSEMKNGDGSRPKLTDVFKKMNY